MKVKSDAEYYAARLSAERNAAQAATSEEARAVHRALAEHYASRLGMSNGANPRD